MKVNLANSRRGIPRGGLKVPGDYVSNSPAAFNARPVVTRGGPNDSPSQG